MKQAFDVLRSQEIQFPAGTKRNRRDSVQCLQPLNGRCILNRSTPASYRNIRAFDSHHNNRSDRPGDDRSAESRISLAQIMPFFRMGRSPLLAIFWRWLVMAQASICNFALPTEGIEPTLTCVNWILSPARLPIPPRRLVVRRKLVTRLPRNASGKECEPGAGEPVVVSRPNC
jgi:hypothetical protein